MKILTGHNEFNGLIYLVCMCYYFFSICSIDFETFGNSMPKIRKLFSICSIEFETFGNSMPKIRKPQILQL